MPKATRAKSATKAATVQFVEPMYAQLVQQLPDGKDWLHEVKFDGYRCLAGRDGARVTLWSRNGNNFTAQFPNIAKACEQLPARTLLDGEIVAIDANGRIHSICSNITPLRHKPCCSMSLMFCPSWDQSAQRTTHDKARSAKQHSETAHPQRVGNRAVREH